MKQNGVVCWPGPALLFFIFLFKYLISGAKIYRDLRETGRSEFGKGSRARYAIPILRKQNDFLQSSYNCTIQLTMNVFPPGYTCKVGLCVISHITFVQFFVHSFAYSDRYQHRQTRQVAQAHYKTFKSFKILVVPCKGIRILVQSEIQEILLVEWGMVGCGVRNKAQMNPESL